MRYILSRPSDRSKIVQQFTAMAGRSWIPTFSPVATIESLAATRRFNRPYGTRNNVITSNSQQ
jgi:hypothetical protein